jgi:hypothetical protein
MLTSILFEICLQMKYIWLMSEREAILYSSWFVLVYKSEPLITDELFSLTPKLKFTCTYLLWADFFHISFVVKTMYLVQCLTVHTLRGG